MVMPYIHVLLEHAFPMKGVGRSNVSKIKGLQDTYCGLVEPTGQIIINIKRNIYIIMRFNVLI
jgi:hypothetical protein